jgi:hypothetical protein
MSPEELKNIEYDLAICDADSWIYKAAYVGTNTTYQIFNDDGELEGSFKKKNEANDYVKDMESFGIDTSEWVVSRDVEHLPVEHCYKVLDTYIKNLKKEVKAKQWRFFIGRGELERDSIATLYKYKGNREGVEKPYHFDAVKNYLEAKPETTTVRLLEADDVCSVMLYNDYRKNGNNPKRVLVAIDKDLSNSVGAHYNPDTGEWFWITEEEADYNFAIQMLTGDWSTDGIKGLPNVSEEFREKYSLPKRNGVGKATAKAILQDLEGESLQTLYNRVLEAYQSYYGTEQYIYKHCNTGEEISKTAEEILDENCALLYMMRYKDEGWLDYKKRTFKND